MTGPILTFDSGLGGLSVQRYILAEHPGLDHVYVADDLGFPYGDWEEDALIGHCVATIGGLIDSYRPCAVVIACNTASTLVLAPLRQAHALSFVGTVPAIKPAAERTGSGMVSVLGTPGTVKRDYTRALMNAYASHCDVALVGAGRLAALAEAYMRDGGIDEKAVFSEIAPCFVERGGKRTDSIVLACTHYPLLLPVFEKIAPWKVTWFDPAPAIARRVGAVLPAGVSGGGGRLYKTTSGASFPNIDGLVDISDLVP